MTEKIKQNLFCRATKGSLVSEKELGDIFPYSGAEGGISIWILQKANLAHAIFFVAGKAVLPVRFW